MPKYSVQFNGSTQYLSTARILDNSTDLTIEAWIYITATPAANGAFIMGQYVGAGADRTIFNVDSTLKVGFQAGAVSMGSTTTLGLNRWYHVAVTRVGSGTNNMSLYVNGTKEGQMTYTGTFQNTNTTIGYTPNLVNTWLTGYISNLRIVKGTAVYTANFTAPTDPLTAVANTALLTCNDTTIIDGSGNNVTITLNGSPTVVSFSAYIGGIGKKRSVSLNGTNQYLSVANSTLFDLSSTDFTLEGWVYSSASKEYGILVGRWGGVAVSNNSSYAIRQGTAASQKYQFVFTTNGSTETQIVASNTFSLNTWYHLAVVRSGSTFTFYINGVSQGTATNASAVFAGTTNLTIGGANNGTDLMSGYACNVRLVKGQALYSGNFTPPAAPLVSVVNTTLLAAHEDTFIDGSTSNFSVTSNNTALVTDFSPFYVGSIKLRNTEIQAFSVALNGTSQYYTVPVTSSLVFGTGDYTIECWIYPTTTTGRMFGSGNALGNFFCFIVEAGKLVTGRIGFAGAEELISTATVPTNTWTHLAGSRQSGTARIFINGNLDKSGTIGTNYGTPAGANYLGSDGGNYTKGYMSNLRVIKGQAIYTASFTPPTAPLTAVVNTQLLTFNDSVVRDGSSNNLTMTAVGSPPVSSSVTPFGPNFPSRLKFRKVNPSSYSVSFNGSSALSLTGKSLSGANFTIEGWIYFNTFTTNDSPHMFNFGADQNNRYLVWRNSGTGKFNLGAVNTGTYTLTDGATTPVTGSWYHLALVRNGASNYLYVNGIQDATNSAGISSGTSWSIGRNQFDPQVGTHLNGYISNFRVVTGSAVYTSNFNPPSAPLTVVSNTALLTCNDSTIRDSSANNYTITVSGSAATNTTIPSSIDNVPKLKIYSVT